MISMQEAFDTMLNHMRSQQQLSTPEDGFGCYYRNEAGLKCAVGALIPDEVYNPDFDESMLLEEVLIGSGLAHLPYLFMQRCQTDLHDVMAPSGFDRARLECNAQAIAHDYNLEYTA